MLKFLLISNMYPSVNQPGYGSFVENVSIGLNSYNIMMKYKIVIKGRAIGILSKIHKYIKFYCGIITFFFKSYNFIYIHFPNQAIPLLNILYKFRKPQIVINFHGEDLIYRNIGYEKTLGIQTELFCKKYATAIVVPSVYFKEIVLRRNLCSEDKIIVSPSGGISHQYFYSNHKLNSNTIIHLGYVGRLESDKGIAEYLELCKSLDRDNIKYKGTIIGYGTLYEHVKSTIQDYNLTDKITLINGMSQSELGTYYRSFDLLIFCSSRAAESLGLTGIEAMACGTPVIGSKVGGISTYLVDTINGFGVRPKNIDDIVNAVKRYIAMSDIEKQIMQNNAVETGKRYYCDNVCRQLSQDLHRILQ